MNNTKDFILQTSLLLFLQKSYKDVTMKEIVTKTGLSKGAFYHYFNSKEELFKEVVNMLFSMGNQNYETYPHDSLSAFYTKYLSDNAIAFTQLNQLFGETGEGVISFNFFFIMFEAMNRFPEFLQLEKDIYTHSLQAWSKVIGMAKETGEIKSASDNEQIADMFLFVTDGSFIRFLNNDSSIVNYNDYLKVAFDTIYTNLKV